MPIAAPTASAASNRNSISTYSARMGAHCATVEVRLAWVPRFPRVARARSDCATRPDARPAGSREFVVAFSQIASPPRPRALTTPRITDLDPPRSRRASTTVSKGGRRFSSVIQSPSAWRAAHRFPDGLALQMEAHRGRRRARRRIPAPSPWRSRGSAGRKGCRQAPTHDRPSCAPPWRAAARRFPRAREPARGAFLHVFRCWSGRPSIPPGSDSLETMRVARVARPVRLSECGSAARRRSASARTVWRRAVTDR